MKALSASHAASHAFWDLPVSVRAKAKFSFNEGTTPDTPLSGESKYGGLKAEILPLFRAPAPFS